MSRAVKLIVVAIVLAIVAGALATYGSDTPTLGFAPSKPLVEKAIALQVSKTQQQLTRQLRSSPPKFEITNVKLDRLEPLYVGGLPTYRVKGTYNLKFKLSQRQVTQENNAFDIYLQRQSEGKTWRLAVPQNVADDSPSLWRTYLIP